MTFTPRLEFEIQAKYLELAATMNGIGMIERISNLDRYLTLEARRQAIVWLYDHTEGQPEQNQHYLMEDELRKQLPRLDEDAARFNGPGAYGLHANGFTEMKKVILWALGEIPDIEISSTD